MRRSVTRALYLITGLHTGDVGFVVESHSEPPPVDEDWEEIVEVSFTPETDDVTLVQWAARPRGVWIWIGSTTASGTARAACRRPGMPTPGSMTSRKSTVISCNSGPLRRADRVLKQTTEHAAYWHSFARGLPPAPTPEERAEAARLAELEKERERERAKLRFEAHSWGGHLPSERLRRVSGNARAMARLDRELGEAIAAADPQVQREVARWVARRAYDVAGLTGIDWIAPALHAMDQGRDLPRPSTTSNRSGRAVGGRARAEYDGHASSWADPQLLPAGRRHTRTVRGRRTRPVAGRARRPLGCRGGLRYRAPQPSAGGSDCVQALMRARRLATSYPRIRLGAAPA